MSNWDSQKIAKLLFRINLVPSIIAFFGVIMLILSWQHGELSKNIWTLLVGAGLIGQFLYFLQTKYVEFTYRKSFWLYSIILNIGFLVYYIISIGYAVMQNSLQEQAIFIVYLIYPLTFLIFSFKAIALINKI